MSRHSVYIPRKLKDVIVMAIVVVWILSLERNISRHSIYSTMFTGLGTLGPLVFICVSFK